MGSAWSIAMRFHHRRRRREHQMIAFQDLTVGERHPHVPDGPTVIAPDDCSRHHPRAAPIASTSLRASCWLPPWQR